ARIPEGPRPEGTPGAEHLRRLEQTVKDQGVDLRRFVVASLDSFATRIISDVRDLVPAASLPVEAPPPPPKTSSVPWPWAAAAVAGLATAAAFGVLWYAERSQGDELKRQMASMETSNADLRRGQQDLTDTIREMSSSLNAAAPLASAGLGVPVAGASGSASTVRTENVPYGEVALDRGRLDVLREVLGKLEAQGFHGVVRITSFAGSFCLSGANESYALAAASLPVSKCDIVGNPFEESLAASQRQSVAFANLVNGVRQRSGGTITVTVEGGSTRAAVAYPPRSDGTTAGEWNRAAAANNRVEFSVEPSAG
ncbi:MAG: hypothetical protein JSS24_14340, partial [Proteobacteria bacterium]|nr:hypothetical protein [Pseudomonadota bacterium]